MNWKWSHIPIALAFVLTAESLMQIVGIVAAPGYGTTSVNITVTGMPSFITAPTVTNGAGATSITSYGATLNGEITDNGGENPTAYIYWGSTDGGTTPASWDNAVENLGIQSGAFSFDADNCTDNTTYFYRASATNSGGTGWASSTANWTTLLALGTPTSLNITDGGGIMALGSWALGENATETEIRFSRESIPTTPTAGELFYSGNLTSANLSGFSFVTTTYYFSAWGKIGDSYSTSYATASVGGEDMEAVADAITTLSNTGGDRLFLITQVFMVLGFAALTRVWRHFFVELIAGGVAFFVGLNWFDTYAATDPTMTGIAYGCMGLGAILFFELVVKQFRRRRAR